MSSRNPHHDASPQPSTELGQDSTAVRSRRDFVRKAAYMAPVIMTLSVRPTYAGGGSAGPDPCGPGHGGRHRHRGLFRALFELLSKLR